MMHAVPNLRILIGNGPRPQPLIDWLPRLAPVIRPERPSRRDGNKNPLGITRVQNDRVQTHATGARRPVRPRAMSAQSRKLLPVLPPIRRAKQRRLLDPRI